MTKKHKTEKHDLSKRNNRRIASTSDISSKRCFIASLISAVCVIILFAMMDNMTFTAYLWKVSWLFIILGVSAVGASVYYTVKVKNASVSEDRLLFTPSLALYFSSLLAVWSVIFALSAQRYIPIFIVINVAFIILYFIHLHFKRDFFSFSLYTATCAGLVWLTKIFGAINTGIVGIAVFVCALIALALFAISLIMVINKSGEGSKRITLLPFAVSYAISAVSLILSIFVTGYEFYFITGLMIWFIIFGIVKAVQLIAE